MKRKLITLPSLDFRSLRWRIFIVFGILLTGWTILLTLYFSIYLKGFYQSNLEDRLKADARLSAAFLTRSGITPSSVGSLVSQIAQYTGARVSLIGKDGTVLSDSEASPAVLENLADQPEVQAVLKYGAAFGKATRFSSSVQKNLNYLAVSVPANEGEPLAGTVLRLALPAAGIEEILASIWFVFFLTGLLIVVFGIILARWLIGSFVRPLEEVVKAVKRLGKGELGVRVKTASYTEINIIGESFNQMAAELEGVVKALTEEHRLQSAVLENMGDGVLVFDRDLHLLSINPSARQLLNLAPSTKPEGQSLIAVTKDHEIHRLLENALVSKKAQTQILEAPYRTQSLQATAVPFLAEPSNPIQALLILRDLTELRRVERTRRDFIANISHELRTPLTAIKALAETVEIVIVEDPEYSREMVSNIIVQVDHLSLMVRELLELATLQSGQADFKFGQVAVENLIQEVVIALQPLALQKSLEFKIELEPGLPLLRIDNVKVATVLRNLLHNAIKFSPSSGVIVLDARTEAKKGGGSNGPDWVTISVKDDGPGLTLQDQQRVFERFYKVDQSRTVDSGSGLGLAIAKHIIQGHRGNIWVESVRGRGSTFSISLPVQN